MQKRIVSLLLVLVMLVSLFPAPARATETGSNVDSGMTVEGTNGFGNLLSAELQAEYEAETQDTGNYSVLGLEITGNTATVEYASMEEAVLVVALYSEDGMQLLTSGKTTVDPTEDIATVTIEGNMPEYFQASAYLVDTYDFSPLCASYDTPMYTREMQELLASTVEDYDADRVLQLDEDKTTNFAVYAEDTILVEERAGVNTVASVNDETSTYVIENADERITSLREGDIFAYPYGDNEILIVKVASISVNGTTVTITGAELEMDEVFSHVKIETSGETADAEYQKGSADEGVTFEGFSSSPATRAIDGEGSASKTLKYTLDKKLKEEATYGEASVTVKGSIGLSVKLEFSFYVSLKRQFFEIKNEASVKADVSVSGKVAGKIGLGSFGYSPIAGVYIDFSPEVKLEFSGKIAYNVTISTSVSLTYENKKGFELHVGTPEVESKLEVEGAIFLGVDFNPHLGVVGGTILDVDLSLPVGAKLEAKQAYTSNTDATSGDSIHSCEECLEMELKFEVELEVKLKFLELDKLTLERKDQFEIKIGDMYYSFDDSRFGWGKCPNITHKVTVELLDAAGTPIPGVTVNVDTETVVTNKNGVVELFLPVGEHVFRATVVGETVKHTVHIDSARKVSLQLGKEYPNHTGGGSAWSPVESTIKDGGKIIASGTCGENLTWTLSKSGVLQIIGSGPMDDWRYDIEVPWDNDREQIVQVILPEGVTTIGDRAFYMCDSLTSVSIPDSVTSIGDSAFWLCSGLTSVSIPASVISIGYKAFSLCDNLTKICVAQDNPAYSSDQYGVLFNKNKTELIRTPETLSGAYTIPDSVTSIGDSAFSGCNSLTAVSIPDSVTSIGDNAFSACNNLTSVSIPDSVTSIGYKAFLVCDNLTEICVAQDNPAYSSDQYGVLFNKNKTELIQTPETLSGAYTIPHSVTSIGHYAFYFCISLTAVSIPDSVTFIGDHAFSNCISLTSVSVPDSVTTIGEGAYHGCSNLTSVSIPDSVASIPVSAFGGCDSLTSVSIPDSVASIGYYAFGGCSSLADVYYSGTEEQWNAISILSSNDNLTSATIHFNSTGPAATTLLASAPDTDMIPEETVTEETPPLDAVFGGEYGTEELEDYTLKTASFTGLMPNEEYLLLALAKLDTDDPLAVDNLLYIDQAAAGTDGKLNFEYVQRVNADISYVMACGPSNQNLNNATITLPDMTASGELQAVDPVVVYDGKTLTEGVDYILLGDVSFTEAGSYTCFIRGIHQYTGLVECSYRVTEYIPMENPFEDVFEADYYYDPVLWAVNEGITNGMDATHFAPAGTCTRAQIVTFLWRANGSPASGGTNPFTDVPADAWYTDAVLWAVANGITTGTSATTFSPDAGCTRGQVATFLWRSQGQPSVNGENIFTDIAPGAYYYDAVLWAVANGITNGMGEGLFAPDATCTRGQIVTFLYRAMK